MTGRLLLATLGNGGARLVGGIGKGESRLALVGEASGFQGGSCWRGVGQSEWRSCWLINVCSFNLAHLVALSFPRGQWM